MESSDKCSCFYREALDRIPLASLLLELWSWDEIYGKAFIPVMTKDFILSSLAGGETPESLSVKTGMSIGVIEEVIQENLKDRALKSALDKVEVTPAMREIGEAAGEYIKDVLDGKTKGQTRS